MTISPTEMRRMLRLVPISKGTKFNTLIGADTNIFDEDLSPTYDVGIFRITVAVSPSAVVRVRITRNAISKNLDLNEGSALTNNALYTFDIPVRKGDQINIRTSVGTTLQYLTVDECGAFAP